MESYEKGMWSLKDVFVHIYCCVFGVGIFFFEPAIRVFGLTATLIVGIVFILGTFIKNAFIVCVNDSYLLSTEDIIDIEKETTRAGELIEMRPTSQTTYVDVGDSIYTDRSTNVNYEEAQNGESIEMRPLKDPYTEGRSILLNATPIIFTGKGLYLRNPRSRADRSILGGFYDMWSNIMPAVLTGISALSLGLFAHSLLSSLMAFTFSSAPGLIQPVTAVSFLVLSALIFKMGSCISSILAMNISGILFTCTFLLFTVGHFLENELIRIFHHIPPVNLFPEYRPRPVLATGLLIAGLYKCEPFESCLPRLSHKGRMYAPLIMAGAQILILFAGCMLGAGTADIGGFYGALLTFDKSEWIPQAAMIPIRVILSLLGAIGALLSMSSLQWDIFKVKPIFKRLSVTIGSVLITLINNYLVVQSSTPSSAICTQVMEIQLLMAASAFIGIPLQFILKILRNISWRGGRIAKRINVALIVFTMAMLFLLHSEKTFSRRSSLPIENIRPSTENITFTTPAQL